MLTRLASAFRRSSPAGARFLLHKGYSGIGNKVLSFLQALVYARLTRRELLVDWNDFRYSADDKDVFRYLFESPAVRGGIEEVARGASVAPGIWRRRLRQPVQAMARRHRLGSPALLKERLSVDTSRLDYPETIAVLFDYSFRYDRLIQHADAFPPEWRGKDESPLVRQLLRDFLSPRAAVTEPVQAFARARFRESVIGVHIRQTDNMSAARIARKGVAITAYAPILDALRRARPGAALFLATDNEAVLRSFQEKYPGVLSYPKWFPTTAGEALHGNARCPDKRAMAVEALVELYLLARCDALVFSSRSSYGWLAKMISERPDEESFDVEALRRVSA